MKSGTWGALVTAPTAPVVSLDLARLHCRIDMTDEDLLIAQWVEIATRTVERDTDTRLLTQTWDIKFDEFPEGRDALELPAGPVQSVTSLKYWDTTPTEQTWASSNYLVDTSRVPGRIGLTDVASWPSDVREFQPITVRAVLGWTAATLPIIYQQAVLLLVAHYAEHRESVMVESFREVPLAYWHLLGRHPTVM